ncbi:MAG: leucine--tRNA ligase [Chloroflexi bacterium]|nr:leucine--tRNA ligase [Chloroflexota bacterium]
MIERYDPKTIEKKWQERWAAGGLYQVSEASDRPKWYALTMFPYTSGDLHIGHWYAMAPSDTAARFRRMLGYNVLHPMGFDAFGLPAENAAIKHGIHPFTWTMRNVERMRGQLRTLGAIYPWDREVVTCLPDYYTWNQWLFLQFLKAGLAYRTRAPANWCPGCQTVLANEQVADGRCERCESLVTKRDLAQWFFRITNYAEELLRFEGIEWPERVMTMQRNWIGRSEGVQLAFPVAGQEAEIEFFTTRPDTIYGVTFMVLAPEHPLVEQITTPERRAEVVAYVEEARRRTEIERLAVDKEKTGVFTGAYAMHRFTGEPVPIFIADYVLMGYGTGAIMAVPAHDERDFVFAQKYALPIPVVIAPPGWDGEPLPEAYVGHGRMVSSGPFNGTPSEEGKRAVADSVREHGWGDRKITYRLRDWLISRQRMWGTPIPMINCERCGIVPVPEEDLPVVLPENAEFRPTGESPLKHNEAFLHVPCPHCGSPAHRETDTMDTFVDSSWYQLRYASPQYAAGPFDPEKLRYWCPVDQYTGGVEHATMHLLYARFFTKVVRDLGLIDFGEPFTRLFNQGIILGEDNEKMSKSRGNVVNPDDYVEKLGADTVRTFLMFIGPWDQGGSWSSTGINGMFSFLNRVWTLVLESHERARTGVPVEPADERELQRWMHRTIQRVTEDIGRFRFNTMLAGLMEYVNYLRRARETPVANSPAWDRAVEALLLLLAPSAPHMTEELWARTGHPYSIHDQTWPAYDEALAKAEEITLVVQVNGKVRDRIVAPADLTEAQARHLALASPRVHAHVDGRKLEKVIYVPGRLVNVVVR